ncbi:hypothetical protein M8C21_011117 [Ambrosia artemisiifolia]|uniref:Uncharacterized protein n=1 Tax=Ambrosia artemisiifolia TaxID=4212 RepID=A0AAD5G1D9_AMBAR|nr:hypothetical protein M8C21_011117 [Ambrosia artemisiifolia]
MDHHVGDFPNHPVELTEQPVPLDEVEPDYSVDIVDLPDPAIRQNQDSYISDEVGQDYPVEIPTDYPVEHSLEYDRVLVDAPAPRHQRQPSYIYGNTYLLLRLR